MASFKCQAESSKPTMAVNLLSTESTVCHMMSLMFSQCLPTAPYNQETTLHVLWEEARTMIHISLMTSQEETKNSMTKSTQLPLELRPLETHFWETRLTWPTYLLK